MNNIMDAVVPDRSQNLKNKSYSWRLTHFLSISLNFFPIIQLTMNKIMDEVLPERSQQAMAAIEISPFDGLPLEEVFLVR